MRTLALLLPAAWLALSTAPAASAPMPFRGSFDVLINTVPIVLTVEGTGTANVNRNGAVGALTSLELPAGVFQTTALDFPGTGAISQIRVTASNGFGSFPTLTNAGGSGIMPIFGMVSFCLRAPCDDATAILGLPLDPVGAGGTASATLGGLAFTVEGMPWTKGTTTISTTFAVTILQGFAHGPLSNTGTTALQGGLLELVTPAVVRTNIPGLDLITGYATLRVQLVPEPGSAVLLAGGLALLGLRTRRSR